MRGSDALHSPFTKRNMLNALILSIGDELVLGQTVDTNSAWLSRQLAGIGVDIAGHMTVPDGRDAVAAAIRTTAEAVDVLVISGGLGPTEDDLTREALADAMGVDLVKDDGAMATLRAYFDKLGRAMPQRNEVQAFVPRGARAIPNGNGTAPGISAEVGRCRVVVMPGVPKEMFRMWEVSILPELKALVAARGGGGAVILSRTLHTFGMGESAVAQKLGDLMNRKRNPSVGTTVSQGIVSLRLNVRGTSRERALAELDETDRLCREALGSLVYAQDDDTLATVVAAMLRVGGGGKPLVVTTAESCTGGLLAKYLTDIPGSSAYFTHGFVCYSNAAKAQLLGVDAGLIEHHGAVSEPVALAMARGALEKAGADLAVSVTGVAGPDGGTPTKPVGTVSIGLAWRADGGESSASARTFLIPGDREFIRDRSAKMGLALLRYHLLREQCPF